MVTARNGYDPSRARPLNAYHTYDPWGVLADHIGLTVFNSHWLADGDWFPLPQIKWADLAARSDMREA
jgi:hypothetical protein